MNALAEIPSSALPAAEWQLEFARLIAFTATPPAFDGQQWWQELTSLQPEQSVRRGGTCDERGPFQEALLSLTLDPTRIIWEARSLKQVDRSGHYPTLGGFREKVRWFQELLAPWLARSCPAIYRLCFSAKLLHTAASAHEAYERLKRYLPGVNVLESEPNDFVLQINRRKPSSAVVEQLPINRVSTWSKMGVAVLAEPGKPFDWPDECYCVVELDVNTAPEKAVVLPAPSLPDLFNELVETGVRIADRRDAP